MDKIILGDHSNETSLAVLLRVTINFITLYNLIPTFDSLGKIHEKRETFSVVLSRGDFFV